VTPDAATWRGRSVLVTGHTGFKGSWLALWLQQLGARVHGYALPPEGHGIHEAARVAAHLASDTHADLRDAAALGRAMRSAQPEVVFHLAAQPLVRRAYAEPVDTVTTNVVGTMHVLEAVRATPSVRAVMVVTTDKVYADDGRGRALRETDALGGHDPYASSKACAELLTASWRDAFLRAAGVGVATARAGNVIGGGDHALDRLLPDFLRALDARQPLTIRAPDAVRPWQHVLEPLAGYLRLARRLLDGDAEAARAWNFGPDADDARPVRWIVERLRAAAPEVDVRVAAATDALHETLTLRLDASAARERLGCMPRWRLDTALDRTLDWHRAWRRGDDMRAGSIAQIDAWSAARPAPAVGAAPRVSVVERIEYP
jgi:CDP-glucose 4,6-dehydratase